MFSETRAAYVYIMGSRRNGTLYTGVTNDLARRVLEHKSHAFGGFTAKYGVDKLVWFAAGEDMYGAITMEKFVKNHGRKWKLALIEASNPGWRDLSLGFLSPEAVRAAEARGRRDDGEGRQLTK